MALFSKPSEWLYHEGTCHGVGHTWSTSCLYSSAEVFCFVAWEGFKIYLPIYIIADLIRRKSLRHFLLNTFPYVLRSSLFLGVNGGGFVAFICTVRKLVGRFYYLSSAFLPAVLASFCAIMVERKSRRGLLMGYVGTIAVETLYTMMKYRGIVHPPPGGEVLIFSLASAVLLYCYRSDPGFKNIVGSIMKFLFNPVLPVPWLKGRSPHTPFPHKGAAGVLHFVGRTVSVCAWSFAIGYLIQCLLNMLSLGKRLLRNPLARLKQAFTNHYNTRFGLFLASLTGLFKVMNAVMYVLAVPRKARLMINGFLAGLSMWFIRSTSIALYTGSKALEVLFFRAVEAGWCRSYYYADVVLYSIFTAVIFHSAMFEGHNLRIGYWNFLVQVTHGRVAQLNFEEIDCFGTEASTMSTLARAKKRMESEDKPQQKAQGDTREQNRTLFSSTIAIS